MAKSNVYIKSGLWKNTDKPVKGELSLDSVINTVVGTAGVPQLDIVVAGGDLIQTSYCNSQIKSVMPIINNSFQTANFWEVQFNTVAQSIAIPNESYFISISANDDSGNLETFSAPNLINCGNVGIYSPGLTTVNIGEMGSVRYVSGVFLSDCALSEETVNYILALLVSLDGTNNTALFDGDVNLSGGTNAAPTGQGLTDKQTLIDRGANVTTN
jgi:hypothetical protein